MKSNSLADFSDTKNAQLGLVLLDDVTDILG